jgi:hypothetical protein
MPHQRCIEERRMMVSVTDEVWERRREERTRMRAGGDGGKVGQAGIDLVRSRRRRQRRKRRRHDQERRGVLAK